ncbi:MAG: hypothetical protein NTZ65_03545 [Candidatus Berkelbacteria bacterium]|nr:hypothetical protein [Candidatus Berkelbacteria bacterium]
MQVLWITGKQVDGAVSSPHYPDFLKGVEVEMEKLGHKIHFIFFSDTMKKSAMTKNNFFYEPEKIEIKNTDKIAAKLENLYKFTFKQAYFPDQIQVSKYQDYRKIHLPEKEFRNLSHLIPRFLYLEKVIEKSAADVVFCDQSSEVEMEFGRSICLKKKKMFLRQAELFLGQGVFYQQFEFGKEVMALPVLNKGVTMPQAKKFVDDFVKNNRSSYARRPRVPVGIKSYYLPRLLRFYRYPQFVKLALISPFLFIEEKVFKKLYEDKYDSSKPYLFFGFHLPTESTISLRGLPYMTQLSLIESISRVLPIGYYLYVREHPDWRKHFPFSYLKKIKELPCVRIIPPKIPISTVLKNSRGVLAYGATTGIEALLYGKPVLSFAPNVYYGLHKSVGYCSNLFELGAKLVKLVNTKVEKEDTYKYIHKMLRSTSDISLDAGTFLSGEDSKNKAQIFTKELLSSIDYLKTTKHEKFES